jgi:hypothetical protein
MKFCGWLWLSGWQRRAVGGILVHPSFLLRMLLTASDSSAGNVRGFTPDGVEFHTGGDVVREVPGRE